MMQSAKTEYTKKYNNCLEQEKISDLLGEYSLICESTKWCMDECGSSCPLKQKRSLLDLFEMSKMCPSVCVPRCICPYGTNFESEKGCV